MTVEGVDPFVIAQVDQGASWTREYFAEWGVDLTDSAQFRAAYVAAGMTHAAHEQGTGSTFVVYLFQLGDAPETPEKYRTEEKP